MEKVKHGVGRDKKTIVLEIVESHIDRLSDLARRIRDGGDARLSEDDKLNIRTCAVPQITHTLDMLKMSYLIGDKADIEYNLDFLNGLLDL